MCAGKLCFFWFVFFPTALETKSNQHRKRTAKIFSRAPTPVFFNLNVFPMHCGRHLVDQSNTFQCFKSHYSSYLEWHLQSINCTCQIAFSSSSRGTSPHPFCASPEPSRIKLGHHCFVGKLNDGSAQGCFPLESFSLPLSLHTHDRAICWFVAHTHTLGC